MIILKYSPRKHKEIIKALVHALKRGKTIVYPTDTSYGLACDATNKAALQQVYRIKERGLNKPMHIVVPSLAYARKIAEWNIPAIKLADKFWPGALTLVLPIAPAGRYLKKIGGGTGTIGIRMPEHRVALDLAKLLGAPITATSANPSFQISGGRDSYSAKDVITQFTGRKNRPDIILDAGRLRKRKPSTVVRVADDLIKVLRSGPVGLKQMKKAVSKTGARFS